MPKRKTEDDLSSTFNKYRITAGDYYPKFGANVHPSKMSKGYINKNVQTLVLGLTNTQQNKALITLTAGQAGVLDGIRGNITVCPKGVTASHLIILRHARQDISVTMNVPGTSFTAVTNGPEVDILWSYVVSYESTALEPISLPIEIKTKRKMMAGDIIYLSTISNVATSASLAANLATFVRR